MAKVALIRPPQCSPASAITLRITSLPLGLAYIAAAIGKAGHNLMVIDSVALGIDHLWEIDGEKRIIIKGLEVEEIISRIPADIEVIGLSCMFSLDWKVCTLLISELKKTFPKATIVLGGEHVSAEPFYSLKNTQADIVAIGEGEETIVDILDALETNRDLNTVHGIVYKDSNHKIKQNERRKRIKNINEIAQPAWEYFPMDIYSTRGLGTTDYNVMKIGMLFSRGCPYACTFCSSPNMWGTSWTPRNIDAIIAELKSNISRYNIRHVEVYDLTAIVNKQWTNDLLDRLIKEDLNLTWSMPSGTRSEILDFEVLSKLNKAGLNYFCYAPESGSDRMLKLIKKKVNKEKMLRSIRYCADIGIISNANLIIGMPDERHRDIWLTIYYIFKMSYAGINDINVAFYTPIPGVELYEKVKEFSPGVPLEKLWEGAIDTNYFNPKSFSQHISNRNLFLYLFVCYGVFYVSQYIFWPRRFINIFKNLLQNSPKTKIETLTLKLLKSALVKSA